MLEGKKRAGRHLCRHRVDARPAVTAVTARPSPTGGIWRMSSQQAIHSLFHERVRKGPKTTRYAAKGTGWFDLSSFNKSPRLRMEVRPSIQGTGSTVVR